MAAEADCRHEYLLVGDSGQRPTPVEHVGVCRKCGLFLVQLATGPRGVVATTFRLTDRQLRAAANACAGKGARG